MRLVWERLKLVVEPSGAVALAALIAGRGPVAGRRVGVILSGGNVDLDRLPWRAAIPARAPAAAGGIHDHRRQALADRATRPCWPTTTRSTAATGTACSPCSPTTSRTTSTRARAKPDASLSRRSSRAWTRCYREELRDIVVMSTPDGGRVAAEYVVHGEYLPTDEGLPEARGQRYVLPGGRLLRAARLPHRAGDQLLQPAATGCSRSGRAEPAAGTAGSGRSRAIARRAPGVIPAPAHKHPRRHSRASGNPLPDWQHRHLMASSRRTPGTVASSHQFRANCHPRTSFPRKRESIVGLAASLPDDVIPAHAGIQWRWVRSEARRSLRIAWRPADRVSSGLRPAGQGGLCVPKAPLASPKGHPGKSPRALPVRAVPGKRRPREGRQTTRASCPRTVWLFPSRGRLFPATSRGPGALTRHPWLVGAATAR